MSFFNHFNLEKNTHKHMINMLADTKWKHNSRKCLTFRMPLERFGWGPFLPGRGTCSWSGTSLWRPKIISRIARRLGSPCFPISKLIVSFCSGWLSINWDSSGLGVIIGLKKFWRNPLVVLDSSASNTSWRIEIFILENLSKKKQPREW